MAKGQMKSNKEAKKPKGVGKKPEGPKYMRSADAMSSKLGEHKAPKPAGK